MKNSVQSGSIVNVPAPAAVVAGQLLRVGMLAGVALTDAANGAAVNIQVGTVVDVTKTGTQAWTVGQAIYGVGTTTLIATNVATIGNIFLGVAMAAVGAGAGETVGRVRLNGSSPALLV